MKSALPLFLIFYLLNTHVFLQAQSRKDIIYEIHMNGPSIDTFYVEVKVPKLDRDNSVYQFASTAPGTYAVMDIGRFVSEFKAFDKKGREVVTRQVQVNQWEISQPGKIRSIRYKVAETFDTKVKENGVYRMCGTSLEKDHALLNLHCLLGYFKNKQDADMAIKLNYPSNWEVGTAMPKNEKHYYLASDYDFAVDSPILLGRLSKASAKVGKTKVDIFTYSKTDLIKSDTLLSSMQSMLQSAHQFLKQLPVDHYVFLYHFEDIEFGAWEHSYSSEYVLKEEPINEQLLDFYTHIAAHEFFHIVTPLNIHSEVIERFNFVTPTPSEHLWLYEGVTEWASLVMRLRSGLLSAKDFFKQMQEKLTLDENHFDKQYSLSKLALTSYTPQGHEQYVNIYLRGAAVATLLDIRLLELSEGKKGLREVILELASRYGAEKAFPEKDFFNILVEMTYPQIRSFIESYIRGTDPLPVAEYFAKIGYDCLKEQESEEEEPDFGMEIFKGLELWKVLSVKDSLSKAGVQVEDEIMAVNEFAVEHPFNPKIDSLLASTKIGDMLKITFRRGDKTFVLNNKVGSKKRINKYVFLPNKEATPVELRLQKAWMNNQ
jgi:predicted metalloprotease with PDZ domain